MCYSLEDRYNTCDHLKRAKNQEQLEMKKQRNNLVEEPMENVRLKGLISHNFSFKCG